MSTGTAILLSAVLLSLVTIFVTTKGSRFWKRLGYFLGWIVGLVLALAAFAFIYSQWETWFPRPAQLTELWGVRLGDSESDVVFKKGKPTRSCTYSKNTKLKVLDYEGGYSAKKAWIVVSEETGVVQIAFFGNLLYSGQTQGAVIRSHNTSAEIISAWGQPSKITHGNVSTARLYWFESYNLRVAMDTDKAEGVVVGRVLGEIGERNCAP